MLVQVDVSPPKWVVIDRLDNIKQKEEGGCVVVTENDEIHSAQAAENVKQEVLKTFNELRQQAKQSGVQLGV